MNGFIANMAKYEMLWKVLLVGMLLVFAIALIMSLVIWRLRCKEDRRNTTRDVESIMGTDYTGRSLFDRDDAMMKVVAPDGVDPNADPSYLIINDNGINIFMRTFSVTSIAKRTRFAETFNPLLNFSSCTSSIYVEPISNEEMQRLVNRHILILAAEKNTSDDINRVRQLKNQLAAETEIANDLETENSTYYKVSMIFTIRSESLEKLSSMTDNLLSIARKKNINLACCFAAQSEAFKTNAPFNLKFKKEAGLGPITTVFPFAKIASDSVEQFLMDQKSLSTVFNYQQNDFDQKTGFLLGWNMPSRRIARWDPFLSKSGYNTMFAGMTRSGKSVTGKAMVGRMAHNTRFVAVDSQRPAGLNEGEYCAVARMLNGIIYRIANDSTDRMNLFEVSETTRAITNTHGKVEGEEWIFPLNDEKVSIANNVMMIIMANSATADTTKDMTTAIKINDKVTGVITQMYDELGIYEGKPESLFEDGYEHLEMQDRPRKKLPTMSRFYEILAYRMVNAREQKDREIYELVMSAIKEYVTFCAYNTFTGEIYDEEMYESMETLPDGLRYVLGENKEKQPVQSVRGSRLYYDGQSTISSSKRARFTNIDISSLPASEVSLARSIAVHLIDQKFINRNSENPEKAERLVVIYDEAHYLLKDRYAAPIISAQARTCGKKHVSMWLFLQQLTDAENNPDASVVLENTAYIFLYKHSGKSKKFVQTVTGMTDSQFMSLCDLGGDVDSEEAAQRKGETCLVTGKHCYFIKVAYLKDTEAELVETDAQERARIYSQKYQLMG